jgi:hypothetical protein
VSTEKPPLERVTEAKFVKLCKGLNWLCLKQNVVGRRGYPDRLVIRDDGVHAWVELKRVGGQLSEGQKDSIAGLQLRGCHVSVQYDAAAAVGWVNSLV